MVAHPLSERTLKRPAAHHNLLARTDSMTIEATVRVSLPPVVPDDLEGPQDRLELSAVADVVHHEVIAAGRWPLRGNHADMVEAAWQPPGHDVARIIRRVESKALSPACEELHQVRHAAMIDVRVGLLQTPHLRINGEVPGHVFMHGHLQVETDRAE